MAALACGLGPMSSPATPLAAAGARDQRVVIRTISGEAIESTLQSVDSQGRVNAAELDGSTTLNDLRQIDFPDSPDVTPGVIVLRLLGGSHLYVDRVTLADELCRFSRGQREFAVPIETVRSICFESQRQSGLFQDGIQNPSTEFDRIYVKFENNNLQAVSGIVESITPGEVVFLFQDSPRRLPRDQVYGIVVADFGLTAPEAASALLTLTDGSVLRGQIAGVANGQLQLAMTADFTATLGVNEVRSIRIRSDRLEFLSDLEPLRAVMEPIVTLQRQWQADRSVDGATLSLLVDQGRARREFEKGIGTHSQSSIVFANERGFDRFATTIGIDAETNGRGACVFVIRGDGRELFRQAMRGLDDPVPVELDISGVTALELSVEAGDDLDLGDHANWCDARWFRSPAAATGG